MAHLTTSDILAAGVASDTSESFPASNSALNDAAPMPATVAPLTTIDGGTFGSGPDTLVLTLAEDAFQGDAQTNVTIDGATLTSQPITVTALKSAGQSETFTFKGTFGSGAHDLGVSFLNDAYAGTPTTDRNLYVNGASYDGFDTRPASAVLDTAGTTHFTVPPADDPEATPTTSNGGTFGSGPDTQVVTLAEDAFQGDARANIAIDGKMLTVQPITFIDQPVTVTALNNSGQNEAFTFKGTFGSGAHDLAVSFLNDAYAGTPVTDRNLYVNGTNLNGISFNPSNAVFDTAGTTHFTIRPVANPGGTVNLTGVSQNTIDAMRSIMPSLTRS